MKTSTLLISGISLILFYLFVILDKKICACISIFVSIYFCVAFFLIGNLPTKKIENQLGDESI